MLHTLTPDTMKNSWHKYAAEAVAVFCFVFISAGAVMANLSGELGLIGTALASGLAFMAMVYATHHLSGAHLNPAVTFSLFPLPPF